MSSTPNDLFSLLLDQHVLIQKWIPNPQRTGTYLSAVPRLLWTPQGPDTTPCVVNYNAGFKLSGYSKDYWNIQARVGCRIIAGPLGGGVIGENEDALNALIMAFVNQYGRFDHLQTPDENGNPSREGEFIYLEPGDTPVAPTRNSGLTPYSYGRDANQRPLSFFGTEFIVECALRLKRK